MSGLISLSSPVSLRATVVFEEQLDGAHRRTDRLFAGLMLLQWLVGIVAAIWISPRAWAGQTSYVHIHVWAAIFLGGAISGLPIALAILRPGKVLTRHVIAIGQMLTSGLLVHLMGGRIETHFHYFGSLAFLAFYRDWRVLLTATIVATLDHFVRGMFWPISLFGVQVAGSLRWLEHAGWILFEDVFLFVGIRQNLEGLRGLAEGKAQAEGIQETIEREVDARTGELQREIAERNQVEQALTTSELRYRSLFENMVEGYAYCRLLYDQGRACDYIYLSVNSAFETQSGLKDVAGKKVSEVVPGMHETNPEQLEIYSRVAATGVSERLETYAEKIGIWFSVAVYSHEKDHFVVVFDNITERKRAAGVLLESKNFLQSTLNALSSHIAILDKLGTIIEVNAAWNRFATENHFVGGNGVGDNYLGVCRSATGSFSDEGRAVEEGIRAVIAGQRSEFYLEYPCHSPREQRWFMVRATRFDAHGEVRVVVAHENITVRKQAEEALKERMQLAELEADARLAWAPGGTLAETLQFCCEAIVRHLDGAFARVWTLNEHEQMLEMQASAGRYTHLDGPHGRVPVGQFKIGLIAQERKPHLTNQVVGDPRVGNQDWAKREGMVAFAGYPLMVGDRLIGVIAMFACHPLSKVALDALASVADTIALSIERKRWESELRESNEKFHQLADNITDVFWIGSKDLLEIHYLSPAFERIWGHSVESLYADPALWIDFILPEDRQHAVSAFAALTGDSASLDVEYRILRPDGEMRWVRVRGFQVRDAAGSLIRLTGIVSDITERKLAETLLVESQQRLSLARESAHIGIWDWNVVANKMVWDTQMYELYGIREQDFSGAYDAWIKGLHPEDRERSETKLTAALDGRENFNIEFRVVWPGGEVRDIEARALVQRAEDGTATRMIGVNWDITERRQAAQELEKTHRQLLEASRLSGMAEIATNVLHNVGNVLNSVNVSTDLIIESFKKSGAASLVRVVALLEEHAHDLGEYITNDPKGKHVPAHLAQLSEHLLSRQEAMTVELGSLRKNVEHIKEIVAMQQNYATFGGVRENIDVVALVEDSLRMNDASMSRHQVEIVREFEAVPRMNVEKHKILQILVNLLRNAKYACDDSDRPDKRLTVRVTVRVTGEDGRVSISVIDNGVGILPENLTRIFNHGFTTRKSGHGFGLHSGALAAREMGGSLTAQSDGPGQGATFTLELPCQTQENSHE